MKIVRPSYPQKNQLLDAIDVALVINLDILLDINFPRRKRRNKTDAGSGIANPVFDAALSDSLNNSNHQPDTDSFWTDSPTAYENMYDTIEHGSYSKADKMHAQNTRSSVEDGYTSLDFDFIQRGSSGVHIYANAENPVKVESPYDVPRIRNANDNCSSC